MASDADNRAAVLEHAELWPGTQVGEMADAMGLKWAEAKKLLAEMLEAGELDLRSWDLRKLTPAETRKLSKSESGAGVLLAADAPEFSDPGAIGRPRTNHQTLCGRCHYWIEPGAQLVVPFSSEAEQLCPHCASLVSERNTKRARKALPLFLEGRDLGAELDALEDDDWPEFEEFLGRARLLDEAEPMWVLEPKTSRRWRLDLDNFSIDYSRGTKLDLTQGKDGSWKVKPARFDAP